MSVLVTIVLVATTGPSWLLTPASAGVRYTVQSLHFKVRVGPGGTTTCDVVGDLYAPTTATARKPVPAVLATHGFGGSKEDLAAWARSLTGRGYAVLAYSGLGFGGSGCQITFDHPDWDGRAGSQLISFLGGAPGIAYADVRHTKPAPTPAFIVRDKVAHHGRRLAHDPRVGMVGGSYGGHIQFAIASVDPRLDAIVPSYTWNDLTYSLSPNNTDQLRGDGVTTRTPGAAKLTWGLLLSVGGAVSGLQHAGEYPDRLFPCASFTDFVCPALLHGLTLGYLDAGAAQDLRKASVASYVSKIRIPTLLVQGETDTLFNLNEAAATYHALQRQRTETKMIWVPGGHSAAPVPASRKPATEYESVRTVNWLDRYLKGRRVSTGPEFSYFRDWVRFRADDTVAYGHSSRFPVPATTRYFFSGTRLVGSAAGLTRSAQTIFTAPAGLPTNFGTLDALGSFGVPPGPEVDLPGTTARWETTPLTRSTTVVGSPKLSLTVDAPVAAFSQIAGPAGDLVLFVRLQDVGPDGRASDIKGQTAPVRVPDVTKPFTVTMPGIAHRFAPGHRIRLVVSSSSVNYRGGLVGNVVTIRSGNPGQVLQLPVVP